MSSSVDMNLANLALDQCKYAILRNGKNIFVSTLFFNLKFYWDETIPTACTNGVDLIINPSFFLSLEPNARITLINHEIWHVAFKHLTRLEQRNPFCFNKACDYVINEMLVKQGFTPIPNWLCDSQYYDKSAEQIYEILYQDPANHNPSSYDDIQFTNPNASPQVNQQINNNILKATIAAQGAGQGSALPSSIVQGVTEMLTPPVNWQRLFQRLIQRIVRNKLIYKKPRKQYMPEFIIPSRGGKAVGDLLFAVDSSGSVSDEDLAAFLGQANIARNTLKPEKTILYMFDTDIQDRVEFKGTDKITYLDFKGRGGTDPTCIFEEIKDKKLKPKCLVIFSDMDFRPLDKSYEPNFPVIWISYKARGKSHVNFGTIVVMPESK